VNEADASPTPGLTGLLINTRARQAHGSEAVVREALARRGIEPGRIARVKHPKHLVEAVESLLEWGADCLIVGGGDGTLSSVAGQLAHRKVVMGVIPLGTANDFARTLGIPAGVEAAAEVIAGGNVRLVDLAKANDAYFLNVASLGMSVSATGELSPALKKRFGILAYLYAGARAFTHYTTFRVRVRNGPDSIETSALQIVVGNGRFYGGGVLVAPQSTLEDGMLHAYALGTRGRWQLLRTIALLRMRVPINRPGDYFLQTTSLHVETWPGLKVDCDGELRTQSPVTFTVDPEALRVLAPSTPSFG
jgi:diacylglycerol kinase (ATP)